MCERSLSLRALVNERLTAAAEEIFALVERTIVEYEEELCRSKEENQRKQQLLDSVLNQHTTQGVQIDTFSPDPGVKQKRPQSPQIKEKLEERGIKQEEELLTEFTAVCVKSEEPSSLLQQRQSEHSELTQGEHCGGAGADISLDPHGHLHSETEEQTDNSSDTETISSPDTDHDEDWEPAASSSTAQMETEADGDHYNQVQIKDTSTAAHYSDLFSKYKSGAESRATVTEGHVSGTGGEDDKKHECTICMRRYKLKHSLKRHMISHTEEKRHSCLFCKKKFNLKSTLMRHIRTHTGEKPYSCSVCNKTFAHRHNQTEHMRVHTGDKPYNCLICMRTFALKSNLITHTRTHTGEKPYSCSVCMKTFTQGGNLKLHMRRHKDRL